MFRFRRAGTVERQQIKWLAWVGVVAVASSSPSPSPATCPSLLSSLINIGFVILVGSTLFVAVTRLGLYEIDRLISRTLAYTIVALVVAAVYLGGDSCARRHRWSRQSLGGGGRHPGGGGALHPGAAAGPGVGGPPLRPSTVRQ